MTLSALLIILLLLPGFIFSLAYYNSDTVSLNISLTHKTIASLFITVLLHAIGLFFLVILQGKVIDFDSILLLVSGTQVQAFSISNHAILDTVRYCMCLYIAAYMGGFSLRWGIKKYNLDRFPIFRIDNPWYYLFKGFNWIDGMPDGVKIAATMEIAGSSYLYVGLLDNFFLDREGNIDRLVLVSASRRTLQNDKGIVEESDRFYPIDGHYFVLKYHEVKNLNIEYFNATKDKNQISIHYVSPKE